MRKYEKLDVFIMQVHEGFKSVLRIDKQNLVPKARILSHLKQRNTRTTIGFITIVRKQVIARATEASVVYSWMSLFWTLVRIDLITDSQNEKEDSICTTVHSEFWNS
jgi:hypothetical protein